MIGLRIRLQELAAQPGERRISVHWFAVPVGVGWSVAGVIGVRDWLLNNQPDSMYWGLPCALLGLVSLLTFVMCQHDIRQGKPPKNLFTIRVRPLVLFGGAAAYMVLCIAIYRLLPQMAWALPFTWVIGSALIWNSTVRYFRHHPPNNDAA